MITNKAIAIGIDKRFDFGEIVAMKKQVYIRQMLLVDFHQEQIALQQVKGETALTVRGQMRIERKTY
jgi:hypothetical protein